MKEQLLVAERIKYVLSNLQITYKKLSEETNYSEQSLYRYLNGSREIPLRLILYILNEYPQISTDWLLFGEGEMEVDRNKIDSLNKIIEEKDRIIKQLQHEKRQLEYKLETILANLK